ncbi:MAG: 4-hydroxy-tetrahydrodipicolinate reductase [Saprospiraceae bacterium]|nr:4-hydroxy-tetrahydrodipicolinate reductase [Saprospiraceae bacterium]
MRVAIIGYGKMGKEIEQILLQRNHTISHILNSEEKLGSLKPGTTDVAIEFSHPESAFKNIYHCINEGIPIISGTTGWLDQKRAIDELCTNKGGAFLYASNFSIGVNLFFELNKRLASLMAPYEEYNAGIHEIHHTSKKDAPSGTAITLAENLIENHHQYEKWELNPEIDHNTLPISAERIKDVPGTHIIKYESDIDDITIKHVAKSRKGFAMGAVLAAEWILDKQGIFTMSDVLF